MLSYYIPLASTVIPSEELTCLQACSCVCALQYVFDPKQFKPYWFDQFYEVSVGRQWLRGRETVIEHTGFPKGSQFNPRLPRELV